MAKATCPLLLLTVAYFLGKAMSVSFEEDTKLTSQQAEMLAKFRQRVLPKLPHKYMEESIFLIRWLRARNFDLDQAEDMLLRHLKWRRDNRIDSIDQEDWREFEAEFPWNMEGVDKEGRPVVQYMLRDWDIRQAAVSGKRDRLIRWVFKYFEDATKQVRKYQGEGKNVTQFILLLDAEGFNPVNHGCALCMPIYFALSTAYEGHYPGAIDRIHVTNTPEFFNVILRLVWPILSDATRNALVIHGTDRRVWMKALKKNIDESQLLQNFGGTMGTI